MNTPVFTGRKSTNTVLCAPIAANLTTLHAQSVTICCKEEAGEDVSREMDPKQIAHIIPNPEMDPGRKWFSTVPGQASNGPGRKISLHAFIKHLILVWLLWKHFKLHNTSFGEIIICEHRVPLGQRAGSEKLNQLHSSGSWNCGCKLDLKSLHSPGTNI